jgi:beta-lactamase regulating signal transducer with metallopeptidase domain
MQSLIQLGLANAAAAGLLAVCVLLVTRVWRNPHFAYALWLIVLLRLIAPPIVQFPLVAPDWLEQRPAAPEAPTLLLRDVAIPDARAVSQAEPRALTPSAVPNSAANEAPAPPPLPKDVRIEPNVPVIEPSVSATPAAPAPVKPIQLLDILAGVWMTGTVLYVGMTAVRVRRFARAVRRSQAPVPRWLEDEVRAIAQAIGLRRAPRLTAVEGTLPPMIWAGWRPTLLVPQTLVESIDPAQRRLLLLHELLHLRRRDHLVRWFAIAVLALHWWNPFAWLAVRKLQNAEEECCDAAVLSFDPQQSQTYGEALLSVSEFVSCGSLPAAAVSLGVERKNHLKRRMTMILKESRWPRLSKTRLAVVLACGTFALGVSLSTAASQGEPSSPAKATPVAQSETPKMAVAPRLPETGGLFADGRTGFINAPHDGPTFWGWKSLTLTPDDDQRRKLLKERHNAALVALNRYRDQQATGLLPPLGDFLSEAKQVRDAELALNENASDALENLKRYLDLTKELERIATARATAGVSLGKSGAEISEMQEARLDAEIELRDRRRAIAEAALNAKGQASEPRPQAGAERTTVPTTRRIALNQADDAPRPRREATPATEPSRSGLPQPSASGQAPAAGASEPKWGLPLEPAMAEDDLHRQLKGRYDTALKSLQVQYATECRACHTNPKEEVSHRALETWLRSGKGESPAHDDRKAAAQTFDVHVRIAEGEVNAARAVVDQKKAELTLALTNLKYRQAQLDRNQKANRQSPGTISANDLDEAIRARDDAAAGVEAAKAAIRASEAQVQIKEAQLEQVHLELKPAKEPESK